MSENSAIEWTDNSWSPIRARGELGRHYCLKISPGCQRCYAGTFNRRLGGQDYAEVSEETIRVAKQLVDAGEIYLDQKALAAPLRWRKPRKVFLSSMTDIFGEWVPDEWLEEIFDVMLTAPDHTYQVLTKRPRRMVDWTRQWLRGCPGSGPGDWPSRIWLGTSIEEDRFSWRARVLSEVRQFADAILFVSAEPLLGSLPSLDLGEPVNVREHAAPVMAVETRAALNEMYLAVVRQYAPPPIDWLIVGAESGYGARPMDDDWVRDLRDRATAAGVAFFFKQRAIAGKKIGLPELDGKVWAEFPELARAAVGA